MTTPLSEASCPLCGAGPFPRVGVQQLMRRHDVAYFQCSACDLLFTERPYWLDEAYADAISRLDTGAILRNEACAARTLRVVLAAGVKIPRALDFGGGHGVFVRMMRDLGVDFRWFDRHARNHYALGFEGSSTDANALVTAFEVLEHFADPRADLDELFASRPALVLVGTLLHDGHRPGWWYYLLESGQHVAFYSARTMEFIARRYGYDVLVGAEYTLFVRGDLEIGWVRRALLSRLVAAPATARMPARWLARAAGLRSFTMRDHDALKERS